jgi:acyl dehydratase
LRVERERIKSFAAEFDPQPFHLDEEQSRSSLFAGLAASGWHTAALTMRLLVESELKPVGGVLGMGFDEFRWPKPVRPGDELHLEIEVLETRPSKSRPDQGGSRCAPRRSIRTMSRCRSPSATCLCRVGPPMSDDGDGMSATSRVRNPAIQLR